MLFSAQLLLCHAAYRFLSWISSLLGCCHEVRRVLPYQCSQAGTKPWCVVSGLTVVCAWATPPVSLCGRPPEYLILSMTHGGQARIGE
jgi:hypothetical protein